VGQVGFFVLSLAIKTAFFKMFENIGTGNANR
jgi:hypothetical protein